MNVSGVEFLLTLVILHILFSWIPCANLIFSRSSRCSWR